MLRLIYRQVTPLEQEIINYILTARTEHSYRKDGKFWYVVKYNAGTFVHYRFDWTCKQQAIEYKLSPHQDKA